MAEDHQTNSLKQTDARFLLIERPASWWDCAGLHLPIVLIAGLAYLVVAFVPLHWIPVRDCTFLVVTGYPCPFCGFTRSFQAILHGHVATAWANCPLAVPLFAFLLLVFMVNTYALLRGLRITRGRSLRIPKGRKRYLLAVVLLLFIANWIYRLSMGLQ